MLVGVAEVERGDSVTYRGSVEVPAGEYEVRVGPCPQGEEIIATKRSPGPASGLIYGFGYTYVAKRRAVLYRVDNTSGEPLRATFTLSCAPVKQPVDTDPVVPIPPTFVRTSHLEGRGARSLDGIADCLDDRGIEAVKTKLGMGIDAGATLYPIKGPAIALAGYARTTRILLFEDSVTARRALKLLTPRVGASLVDGNVLIFALQEFEDRTPTERPFENDREPPIEPSSLPGYGDIKTCAAPAGA